MFAKIRLPMLCCQVPRFILNFHLYSDSADWALPHDVVLLLEPGAGTTLIYSAMSTSTLWTT